MVIHSRPLAALVIAAFLAACGGGDSPAPGGGGGGSGAGPGGGSGDTGGGGSGGAGGGGGGSGGGGGGGGGAITGTATLSWSPPSENTDGSVLTNLAGYRIHRGTSPGSLAVVTTVASPSATTHVIEALPAGTHYFAVSAFTTGGTESDMSAVMSKTIR